MGWPMSPGVGDDDKLDIAGTSQVLRRSAKMLGPYRKRAVLAAVFLVAWTAMLVAGPLLVRRGIDSGLEQNDATALNTSVVLYIAAAIASYWFYRLAVVNLAIVGEGFLRDLRNRVFGRILKHSMPFFDRNKSGVLISRMTSDVDSLQDLVQMGLLMFVSAVLLLTASAVTLLLLSWKLFLLCLVTLPPVAAASVKFHRDSNKAFLAVRDSVGTTLSSLQEGISGVRIVQAFARESAEAEKFAVTNRQLYRTHMDSVKVAAWYLPVVEIAGAITTAIALGVGGWLIVEGQVTLGTVAAFILILQSMFGPVQQLSQLFNLVQSGAASLNKIYQLLDEPLEQQDDNASVPLPAGGAIEVDNVGFSYVEGEPVLDGVSVTIPAKERIAFVGPTGAGKSTLAKVIARFYDPTVGAVRVGGVDLREVSQDSLRSGIVVVPQEGFLFAGTVADNIRLARPAASDAEVRSAVERIGVAPIFDALPDGLNTEVRERGTRLSAGEKQLVSLARAALVDPDILVLDEATSSIDPGTEAIVEAAMETLMQARTVIVIAHRLSTSERCDRVAVIDAGGITELGTHDALITQGGHYADLYNAWTQVV